VTQIKLDADLSRKLREMSSAVELCDPSGRVLGQFVPIVDMSEWEAVTPEASEEELDRREKSDVWYTTEQVLAHLQKLGN
jgi:hypothetical protein